MRKHQNKRPLALVGTAELVEWLAQSLTLEDGGVSFVRRAMRSSSQLSASGKQEKP